MRVGPLELRFRLTDSPGSISALSTLEDDAMRDHRYRTETALGPEIVGFLRDLELEGKAAGTLYQYERDLAIGAMLHPRLAIDRWTDEEIRQTLLQVPERSRRRMLAGFRSFFNWAYFERKVEAKPTDRVRPIKQSARTLRLSPILRRMPC